MLFSKSRRPAAVLSASSLALAASLGAQAAAQDAPIVQPGAPGEETRALTADEAVAIAKNSYSPADVRFMQDMIPHHYQATQLAALVEDRADNPGLREIAGRIDASQADEIKFMQDWLRARGEKAPDPAAHEGYGAGHEGGHKTKTHMSMEMMGMASPEDMKRLAGLEGTAFDALFLRLMITHHEGAITMVETLLDQPGSAYDPVLYEFVNDIVSDQKAEIRRMNAILAGLSVDPRAGLAPGFRDAGEAIENLTLLASLPKPAGFFDPENPAELPPVVERDKDEARGEDQSNEDTEWGERSPLLSFSNTDMAFYDDKIVVGSYHGFNIYQLAEEGAPALLSSVVCPGGQGDVSVSGDLLIMSVEQTRGRVDCGRNGVREDVSPDRFRGIRIFNIADPKRPVQVGQVQTCRGSHTHSIVSGPGRDGKLIVYNSGTSSVRDEEELAGCVRSAAGDDRTALFRIDVIEIPVADPSKARIIDSPAVFADPKTGRLAGLWQGGDHGDDTQETRRTDQCHDITVFPEANLAAGACSGNGIIFDISNPRKPKRIDAVTDKGFAYWHSATFNNDGTKVLFTDEWGGGSRPRCRAADPKDWGADAIYDIVNGKLEFKSYYKMPAPQAEEENCVAHNGAVVPVPGRDLFVQAWYQGGLSVIDFTDSENPVEIAYFDRGPVHEEVLVLGGYWSTYWYDGKIYGTEIARGLDVFALEESDHLTANEIAAARLANQGAAFNPQQQFRVTWPAHPVVARAYMDQLNRDSALPEALQANLTGALERSEAQIEKGEADKALAAELKALAKSARGLAAGKRGDALASTLNDIAARLR
ncbi:MAG: DUF305 domain-containing protein [Pseudomonadota bacterium]